MGNSIIVILCFVASVCMSCADNDPSDGKLASGQIRVSRFAEEYARENFEHLPNHPDLEKLFTNFSSIAHAHAFMKDDETQKLYHDIIVATFEKDTQRDVHDATFASFLLQITPPEILLEAIVPELGPQGKLHGILDRETADVRKRLEHQSPQGHPGEPDFRHYASYLKDHKDVKTSPYLIRHMFKSAPGKALQAMIYVQYLRVPYPPLRLSKSASVNAEIQPLLYAEHTISDIIWNEQFRFEVAEDQVAKAKNELSALSQHKDWWVRLYAAEIIQQHPELRVPDAIERLTKDEHELVREAMARNDSKEAKPSKPEKVKVPIE